MYGKNKKIKKYWDWVTQNVTMSSRISKCEGIHYFPNCGAIDGEVHPRSGARVKLSIVRKDISDFSKNVNNFFVLCKECAGLHISNQKNLQLISELESGTYWRAFQIANYVIYSIILVILGVGWWLSLNYGFCLAFQRSGAFVVAATCLFLILSLRSNPKMEVLDDFMETLSPRLRADNVKAKQHEWRDRFESINIDPNRVFGSPEEQVLTVRENLEKIVSTVDDIMKIGKSVTKKRIAAELIFLVLGTIIWAVGDIPVGILIDSCNISY